MTKWDTPDLNPSWNKFIGGGASLKPDVELRSMLFQDSWAISIFPETTDSREM